MYIEIESGKYLHTAYAISDVADELLPDEWSTTDREDGMDYIGTYIDDSTEDSTDATDYQWEELYDLDVDDTDDDDEMPVAEEQSQIASVEERLNILEQDIEDLNGDVADVSTNVESASNTSSSAYDIAQATGQHFWTDDNGVHISNEEGNAEGDRNSLWNSLGMLFRKGANYITAILTGGADGDGEKGLAIFDGNGNDDSNVVAKFTDRGSTIGQINNGQMILESDSLTLLDRANGNAFRVQNVQSSSTGLVRDIFIGDENERGYQVGTYSFTLKNDYLGNLVAHFYFSLPHPQTVSYWDMKNIPLDSFGDWSISSSDVDASGTISFDSTTNQVTLTVDSFSAPEGYQLTSFYVEYTSYPQLPTMALGNADLTDASDYIVLIGDGQGYNIASLDRTGEQMCRNVYAQNSYYIYARGDKSRISRHVLECGTTSNDWDYVLHSDGTYEAWRSFNFTGITVTTASAGTYYGTGGNKTLGVPLFPNNSNTVVTSCQATENGGSHSSGVYVYAVNITGATGQNSNITVVFRAYASTSNGNCGVDLYMRGTYS